MSYVLSPAKVVSPLRIINFVNSIAEDINAFFLARGGRKNLGVRDGIGSYRDGKVGDNDKTSVGDCTKNLLCIKRYTL